MIFADTNLFVYAVGRPHPLRDPARRILLDAAAHAEALVTSCEVLQELLHPELSGRDLLHLACCRRRGVGRIHTFDRALRAAVEA